ncbi:hypothetical protein FH972_017776 [Carpinus fangiana]|uniref:Uncharacterized protein n=1 Tax=Carpinus fangiana TaxID=176857 RepID=A0A5N6RL95_9ROSI|nr:hypothetical protein FH972_017776 [Carpinus fangiana]
MPIRFETESDGEGVRFAVDCLALDGLVSGPLEATAGSDLVSSSKVEKAGLMRLLGQLHLKMDRVLCVLGFSGSDLGLNVELDIGVDPGLLPVSLSSDDGLETQGVGVLGDSFVQGWGSGLAIPKLLPVLISNVGLESQGVGDLGELFVQGRGGDSVAIDIGSGFVSAGRPFAEGSVAGFASMWFPWSESEKFSPSGGVEGGPASDQREGSYYRGWVLCLYYLCASGPISDLSLSAGG